MHFNYDPILGLQYMIFDEPTVLVYDIEPEVTEEEWEKRKKRFLELIKKVGVLFIDSTPKPEFVEYQPIITTNHNLDEILFRYGVH